MQLTYRGLTYTPTNTTMNIVDGQSMGTYRGHQYTHARLVSLSGLPQRHLVYRGVAYTTKPQENNVVISDQILALV